MPRFKTVLEAVLSQETPWPYVVLVIDSGSTDGTVEFARSQDRVRVIEIEPKTFGHGRTRNRAIEETDTPYIAMLTHDAQPFDRTWLSNLIAPLEQDDRVAGVFGRHVAYDDADPFTKRDLDAHFQGFLHHPLIVNRDLDANKYLHDIGWRQFLHFFSDNNAGLRRAVWEKIPYPDVEFAEDQIWADTIIEAGYSKAYAPDAVVYHSHNYGLFERFQRAFDEASSFRKLFGYKLAATPVASLKTTVGLSKRDFQMSRQTGLLRKNPGIVLRQVVSNAALAAGHLFGTYAHRLPSKVAFAFSRDKGLRAQA